MGLASSLEIGRVVPTIGLLKTVTKVVRAEQAFN